MTLEDFKKKSLKQTDFFSKKVIKYFNLVVHFFDSKTGVFMTEADGGYNKRVFSLYKADFKTGSITDISGFGFYSNFYRAKDDFGYYSKQQLKLANPQKRKKKKWQIFTE